MTNASQDLQRILDSAQRLGVELDEEEAIQWLTAMAATQAHDDIVVDVKTGVFGHRVSMLDFSPQDLAYFRQVGRLVEFDNVPGQVETALALSGSAAQSKIQTYPGDCDYFERINIIAGTREEACDILARILRQKALDTLHGVTHQFIEAKFGNYPFDMVRGETFCKKGSPIAWSAADIRAGAIEGTTPDGEPARFTWDDVKGEPGWCKLDWVVADTVRGQLANASNMLDVTWEAPDGSITPLDGYLDSYFQEVYLEAESVPIFSKLVRHMSANALDDYVSQLEHEVEKYVGSSPNYGKAAKRMYNIFRLTGRYEEAAFIRELFDEPEALLYQGRALARTIEEAVTPGSQIPMESVLSQMDDLIIAVVSVLEGEKEEAVVRQMLRLRDALTRQEASGELSPAVEAAQAELNNLVNNLFYRRLTGVPTIKDYMDQFTSPA